MVGRSINGGSFWNTKPFGQAYEYGLYLQPIPPKLATSACIFILTPLNPIVMVSISGAVIAGGKGMLILTAPM